MQSLYVFEDIMALFPDATTCDGNGWLYLAGHRLADLAQEWETPLYVYDAATLHNRAATLRAALKAAYPGETESTYTAKVLLPREAGAKIGET